LLLSLATPIVVVGLQSTFSQSFYQDGRLNSLLLVGLANAASLLVLSRLRRLPTVRLETIFPAIYLLFLSLGVVVLLLTRASYSLSMMLPSALIFGVSLMFVLLRVHRRHMRVGLFDHELEDLVAPHASVTKLHHPKDIVDAPIDLVVARFAQPNVASSMVMQRAMMLSDVPMIGLADFLEASEGMVQPDRIPSLNQVAFDQRLAYQFVKRIFDLVLAMLMLPAALLLAGPIALAIKQTSPGPVLFRQARMGWRGKTFVIFKFRTMRADHEGQGFTISKDEERITSVGKFLRKTRLDEIPQLINIIKGEMSWIGPRPESLELAKWYCRDVPLFRIRHLVRPGISGWAQVNQGYAAGVEDVTVKVRYDLYYIKHLSLWLDITILLKTIIVVLSGRGSR
tara:strand:+ start:302 stop:1492 length:1191 start_codon:yes stop_codon:yes gene_type:complete